MELVHGAQTAPELGVASVEGADAQAAAGEVFAHAVEEVQAVRVDVGVSVGDCEDAAEGDGWVGRCGCGVLVIVPHSERLGH